MTTLERPTTRPSVDKRPASKPSDYADVLPMFSALQTMTPGSAEHDVQRDRIINRCLPLADHCAQRYVNRGEPRDDLMQIARLGLVNAVKRFDVDKGVDFLSFAVPTIMGEIKRYFRDSGWSVKVPRRLKETHQQLGAAVNELSQKLGRAPTATELAHELKMDRTDVVDGLIAGSCYRTLSFDAPVGGDDDAPTLADTLGHVDTGLDSIENREALKPLLAALPERERMILQLRFFESMTQTEIAGRLGISQMHVSRLLARSLAKLRDGMLA